jgi:hypothetical protein
MAACASNYHGHSRLLLVGVVAMRAGEFEMGAIRISS